MNSDSVRLRLAPFLIQIASMEARGLQFLRGNFGNTFEDITVIRFMQKTPVKHEYY